MAGASLTDEVIIAVVSLPAMSCRPQNRSLAYGCARDDNGVGRAAPLIDSEMRCAREIRPTACEISPAGEVKWSFGTLRYRSPAGSGLIGRNDLIPRLKAVPSPWGEGKLRKEAG